MNRLAFAIRDAYPVSPGHTLVIPRAHVQDWWTASRQERAAVDRLLLECRGALDAELRPDGYNVGINNGAAAGQTVFHLHVHLIPRYDGDVPDPAGVVRERLVSHDLIDRWLERDHEGWPRWRKRSAGPWTPTVLWRWHGPPYRYLADGMPVWRGKRDLVLFDKRQRDRVLDRLGQASAA